MLEMGARFTSRLYLKVSFDPDNGDTNVVCEFITDEGEVQTLTGAVTWDE